MPLNRREFLGSAAALSAAVRLRGAGKKKGPRPSVLLISVEGLGAWMLGIYGNKSIKTPQLDIQGRSGIRLMNACTAAPAPEPGRASMLAGVAPMQLAAAHATMADTLRQNGYQATIADAPAGSLDACTHAALDFLKGQKADRPFFHVVDYAPLRAEKIPDRCLAGYRDSNFSGLGWLPAAPDAASGRDILRDPVDALRKAAAGIAWLDEQIPLLRGALVNQKLYDSTITVITGTSGQLLGHHGLWGDGRASHPPNMYEEVVRVPFLCSWPGQTPADVFRMEAVSLYDLAATIYDMAGITAPAVTSPGKSFARVLLNESFPKKQPWRNLVFAEIEGTCMARDNRYKLVLQPDGSGKLFDIEADPAENTDHFDDGSYIAVKTRLTNALNGWRNTFHS